LSKPSTTEIVEGQPAFYAQSSDEWRAWLAANGQSEPSVWLIIHHKKSATPSVGYAESIEHALCFGWIDGKALKRDEESFYLRFTPRRPSATWSKVNRERAQHMTEAGLMTPAGQSMIDLAKATGRWEVLTDEQSVVIPDDLQAEFDGNPTALANFEAFPPSSCRLILEWIAKAKKPQTRQRRIEQTVELAAQNIRANHPKRK
jgi:uncharacterized protein YdeI (YjbR/CyaY-like superfamily)